MELLTPSGDPTPASPLQARRWRLAQALAADEATAAVVSPGQDLHYLLGRTHGSFERLSALVIRPGRLAVLTVPATEASAWSWAAEEPDVETVVWSDGDDPYRLVHELLGPGPVAVSDMLPAVHLLPLQADDPEVTWTSGTQLQTLRQIKDPDEISCLRQAARAIDDVHAQVPGFLRSGRTELDVAEDISDTMHRAGFTSVDFVSVASGPSGSDPHYAAGDRVLRPSDPVFVDLSGRWRTGYMADETRCYSLGSPAPDVRLVYDAVRRALDVATAAVRPGALAEDIDAAARNCLATDGLAEHFTHRTGHGIGLDVHEGPMIVRGNSTPLQPGMAFSIEPGVYLPGRFGVRIEDIVVVTGDGCERLTTRTRDLTII